MFVRKFLSEAKKIIDQLDVNPIDSMIDLLVETREKKGRLFFLGVGAAQLMHHMQ